MPNGSRNKYSAQKTRVYGIEFDSQKEARRYIYLRDLQNKGNITDLRTQVAYELIPLQCHLRADGKRENLRACKYIADFVYKLDGVLHVEDVKGYRNGQAYAIFKLKKKLMLEKYGIYVEEV